MDAADATEHGDSFQTNALVDNVLVSPEGFCQAATLFYAKGHDLALCARRTDRLDARR